MNRISLKNLLISFKWRISLTFFLVVIESILGTLFPLILGIPVDN